MKACPHCQSTYEDWIEFCFNDGVPLVAHVPKPAAPAPAAPRPPAPAAADLPEARMVSGADLPEPAFLGRFNRAASPFDAPEPSRAPAADRPTPQLAPRAPVAEPPPAPAPEPPPVVEPAPEPPSAEQRPADEDSEPTTIDPEGPRGEEATVTERPAPVVEAPAPVVPPAPPVVTPPAPVTSQAPPSPDIDADAFHELASALRDPAPSTVATQPFLLPTRAESEDDKATVPMYTAQPERSSAQERSVLDDEEPSSGRRAAAAGGIGVMVAGLLLLGTFVVLAGVGIWWTMSRSAPPEPVAENKPTPVLPAPAPPPTPPAEPPPAPVTEPPVAAAEPVPTPAPTPPPATTPPPTAAPTTTAAASKPPPSTPPSTPPASKPPSTPTTAPTSTARTTTSSAAVTSDSVWGAAPEPTSGMLKIVTNPDGANVFVNETPKGKSPVTVELAYGTHSVKVQKAGYKTETKEVNFRIQEMTVPFALKPDVVTGQVNVYGPDGYRVVVDGHDMGTMPVTVQVSEGARQFKIVGPDGGGCTQTRDIKFKAVGHPETITLACP